MKQLFLKGQYLAVETVFVFGLGLMLAIGVITLFNDFRAGALDSTEEEQAKIINSQIENSINTLKQSDNASKTSIGSQQIDLPGRIAGKDYSVTISGKTSRVNVGGESYTNNLQGVQGYTVSGSVPGGDITVFKQGNQFEIRGR